MQKFEDNVFSIIKTTNLSPSVFSFLQPTDESADKTPLGGILEDTKYGWLALGPKFCVIDLRNGLKVAAHTFGGWMSNCRIMITSVVELTTPLTANSKQLIISVECEDVAGLICVLHVNGSQILRCIQTDVVVTKLAVCENLTDGPFSCFDGVIVAGTKNGEVLVFDLNRASLIQALKDISQGYEDQIRNEANPATITFLPFAAVDQIADQRELALENDDHISILLNEDSLVNGEYIFRNPDGTVRMKAKKDHVRVSALEYVPQLGSVVTGFNFGAFQIWNIMTCELEFTSQVNIECLPVTNFGFQEPCDDPRAFCYLWVVFSTTDRCEEEEFPLAVMYSLTYQGKRMLSDTKVQYQDFASAAIRFQIELGVLEEADQFVGGRCISCHSYSINSSLGDEGEDSPLNLCQIVWECWGDGSNSSAQYGMLLFDLDQWYKDQMPATLSQCSSAFLSRSSWWDTSAAGALHVRLQQHSVVPYSHATRLEEHFYPDSLQYNCICLNTMETYTLHTVGRQRAVLARLESGGPQLLLRPTALYHACLACQLAPLHQHHATHCTEEEQRRFVLSVALEARLSCFLKRCAHAWASGTHAGVGCTISFLVDWAWKRAVELKEYATELTAPALTPACSHVWSGAARRQLTACVLQLAQLDALLDAVLTHCCDRTVPHALNDMEEKYKGVATVSLYFQVVQWFLKVGLLPERVEHRHQLAYPATHLAQVYHNRRTKLCRLENKTSEEDIRQPCSLLYIDQLIENELGGDRVYDLWKKSGSETGLYPPPSLYSLLRLYLLPDISEEHKHALVLYLLVDYSMVYDEGRHESIIRRLMQFPTMFGLSNTAIKATQAFWHLDHRDFDFALDQLQCLTGNTLSEWQHNVVLSSLLAQNKTQAALQYLHVRKPAPVHNKDNSLMSEHDKLSEWRACCGLYLARRLPAAALHVVRVCADHADSDDERVQVLTFFFHCCRKTGQLSKLLSITLTAHEEEVFIRYLEDCNDPKTSDILVMYYLQQSRYLEAKQYNNKLKQSRVRGKELAGSVESINSALERENTRDTLVDVLCTALPNITNSLANYVFNEADVQTHVLAPKPMSVYVQATTSKNTFTYKSSFIQDTIENASETWVNRPKMRKGIKRALNIEEIPFICTPKIHKTRSIFSPSREPSEDVTPAKRAKLDLGVPLQTPKPACKGKMSKQLEELLDMPDEQSPDFKLYERSGAGTPHSILKSRRSDVLREDVPSPVDSRYLGDTDEELDTASIHTHFSDYTNKHLRFTIPTESEAGSTPSPIPENTMENIKMDIARERAARLLESLAGDHELDIEEKVSTTYSRTISDSHRLESPPRLESSIPTVQPRKSYKDTVRARGSLSLSASSLSDDPNTSIESIADIPFTLINPKYTGQRRRQNIKEIENREEDVMEQDSVLELDCSVQRPVTPKGRKSIKSGGEVTPPRNRSRSGTPECKDKSVLASPRLEVIKESSLTSSDSPSTSPKRSLRSRSRTPDIEVIESAPAQVSSQRSLRSRSRTPEIEMMETAPAPSPPRSLRSRSKTPEKLMSPKTDRAARIKKSLSRIVLEANTFAKAKPIEKPDPETSEKKTVDIECTPMKPDKPAVLMDVTLSPINKSILHTSSESPVEDSNNVVLHMKSIPAFTINETYFEKSVLHSYESSLGETSHEERESTTTVTKEVKIVDLESSKVEMKSLPAFTTINMTDFDKSVLGSYDSSLVDTSEDKHETKELKTEDLTETMNKSEHKDMSSLMTSDSEIELKEDRDIQKEKERIVEIEREISEIEGDMSDDRDSEERDNVDESESSDSADSVDSVEEEESESEAGSSEQDNQEVISINDTDESSSNDKLQIDETSNTGAKETEPTVAETQNSETIAQVYIEEANKAEEAKERVDPLVADAVVANTSVAERKENQSNFSLLTDDNSVLESDKSDFSLNYSDEKTEAAKNVVEDIIDTEMHQEVQVNIVAEQIDPDKIDAEEIHPPSTSKSIDVVDAINTVEIPVEAMVTDTIKPAALSESEQTPMVIQNEPLILDEGKTKSKGRKRANSSSSNKSITKEFVPGNELSRTPVTRKRSKSITSNTSAVETETLEVTRELKTPENPETPSRRRAKTPTCTEVRKILTRRASKELSEKGEEPLKSEELVTPQRRTTRSRSRNLDDSISVASEASVKSSASKNESADVKPAPIRKGRKSILATKPDLSVIPENTVEDSKVDASQDIIGEYSSSRRLTRHQKSLLSSWMETKPRSGRTSAASRASVASDTSMDADDNTSVLSSTINERLDLLNKEDFDGSPDPDEMARSISPSESIASDASKQKKSRLSRAASETKATPKAAKINRRVLSVDIAATPEQGSPTPGLDSPARGRRASFNRACEALHTPKGRRPSTDVRKSECESVGSSPSASETSAAGAGPSATTPARRGRRPSTQSNTSTRSKKSAAEDSQDSKKK